MAKYIVTRSDGTPIPEDEPCFVIRAKDIFAPQAIGMYSLLVWPYISEEMKDQLDAQVARITEWQHNHKSDLKVPD